MNNKFLKRASGVLMPVFSLPGEYSVGSFGKEAREFIDFLSGAGFTYWQVLPFGITDEYHSPYKAFSAFAGNPYFIDLPSLYEQGLLTQKELESAKQKTPYVCEYSRLLAERLPLLKKAAFRAKNREEVKNFVRSDKNLLASCRFMALREVNGGKEWKDWTAFEYSEDTLFFHEFLQYEFFCQWSKVREYAAEKGIKIIGDIPIYVSYDSADVYFNRELFLTDADGAPSCVAGVPPDYFSETGQLWGNPIYDWKKMKKDNYAWWRERMEHEFSFFDGVRLDHFRGFEAYWSIPSDAEDARSGRWETGPREGFVDMVKDSAGDKLVIAEDLGVITKEVAALRDYAEFPGMRVLQFSLMGNDSPHLPHNYINNCVAYTGTHDNNTLLGWVWELDDASRKTLLEYFGYSGDWDACYDSLIRGMLSSAAGVVVLPIQDILGFGSDTRVNRPGQADGNWSYRVTKEQLNGINKEKYRRMNELYARINK